MTSDFYKFMKLVAMLDKGSVVHRSTLLTMPSLAKVKRSYIETLRLYFTRAGYLETVKPGHYKRTKKKINMFMSYTDLQEQAYPGTRAKRQTREKFYRDYARKSFIPKMTVPHKEECLYELGMRCNCGGVS